MNHIPVQCSVTKDCKRQVVKHSKWDDFTPELWAENNLKHLRDAALPFDQGVFVYDPEKECFNFQEEYQEYKYDEEFVFSGDKQLDIEEEEHQLEEDDDLKEKSTVVSIDESGRSPSNTSYFLYVLTKHVLQYEQIHHPQPTQHITPNQHLQM